MRLAGIVGVVVLSVSCGSNTAVKDLKTATLTLSLSDEEFLEQDPIRTIALQLTSSTSCLSLDPSVTATMNGVRVAAAAYGGTMEVGGVACNIPSWGSDLSSLDGGALTFALSDSSGTATATFTGGDQLRSITPESTTLQSGTPARFDWVPATDQVTTVTAELDADGGTAWTTSAFTATSGGFTFTPPSPGAGSGLLHLNATATAPVSACTGFGSCVDTVTVQRFIPVDDAP